MAIEVTPDRVRATAELARLDLREDEVVPFAGQLQKILDAIAQLDTLDTTNVPPTSHVVGLGLPLEADVRAPGLARDEVLAQAPRAAEGGFVVPQFVEE